MTAAKQIGTRTKKVRGIAQKTRNLRDAILEVLNFGDKPFSVRGVYYQLEVREAVDKTEAGYRRAQRQLVEMRRAGIIPYSWISDNTRWMRKPNTYSGVEHTLRSVAHFYRRDVWEDLDHYVEVWCEKNALAGVLYPITSVYDVPLMVTVGYSSDSFAYEAAEAIKETEKQGYIYYLGDHDPSGWHMAQNLEEKLRGFGADIIFERLAVNPEQIKAWNLPTRETKKTDTRCKDFFSTFGKDAPSVELDAVHPDTLRALIREAIEQHLPEDHMVGIKAAEESEREIFGKLAELGMERLARIGGTA